MALLLPLFPLDTVLLPSVSLPLHIFEPRYKEMIAECLKKKMPFGVVRAKEKEGIAETGCTAEILEVLKRHPDGSLDILTVGRRRFELLEVNRDREFLQGQVMFVDDEPGGAGEISPEDREHALELFHEILEIVGGEDRIDTESGLLSYQLAGALPIDLDFKQALLGVHSEDERLAGVIEFLEAILPKLRKAQRQRDKAGGNGHVP